MQNFDFSPMKKCFERGSFGDGVGGAKSELCDILPNLFVNDIMRGYEFIRLTRQPLFDDRDRSSFVTRNFLHLSLAAAHHLLRKGGAELPLQIKL